MKADCARGMRMRSAGFTSGRRSPHSRRRWRILFTQLPGLSSIAKFLAGVHPQAEDSGLRAAIVQAVVSSRTSRRHPVGPPVVLFADTFNNHFHPDVAIAATEVLEDAGFRVHVPMADVCCGRPLYDYGFLGMAKRWWIDLLRETAALLPATAFRWSCSSQAAGRRSRMNCST